MLRKRKSTGWFDTAQQSAKASRMFDETVQKYQGKTQADRPEPWLRRGQGQDRNLDMLQPHGVP